MKIVIVGAGSIGMRHLNNLIALGYKDLAVVSKSYAAIEEYDYIKIYKTIEEAIAVNNFDTAFVCSVTASHVYDAIELLQAGITNLYIEKPVSNNWQNINKFIEIVHEKNANIKVGYDLHFDLGFLKVKQILQNNMIGKPVSANAFVGQCLPDWRPQQDYTKTMSAKKETGGGVMLDLVHEFDYLLWLIGEVNNIAAHYTSTNTFNIETEDVCDVLLKFSNGATGTIHLDYLQPQLKRNCIITCSEGTVEWDYVTATVKWIDNKKEEQSFHYEHYQRNERFKDCIKTFLENKNDDRLTSLEAAIESLKLVLAAKHSSEQQVLVNIKQFTA